MKVHVYPRVNGKSQALIIPGRAAHLPPVLVSGGDKEAFMAELAAAIEAHSPTPGLETIPL